MNIAVIWGYELVFTENINAALISYWRLILVTHNIYVGDVRIMLVARIFYCVFLRSQKIEVVALAIVKSCDRYQSVPKAHISDIKNFLFKTCTKPKCVHIEYIC